MKNSLIPNLEQIRVFFEYVKEVFIILIFYMLKKYSHNFCLNIN